MNDCVDVYGYVGKLSALLGRAFVTFIAPEREYVYLIGASYIPYVLIEVVLYGCKLNGTCGYDTKVNGTHITHYTLYYRINVVYSYPESRCCTKINHFWNDPSTLASRLHCSFSSYAICL
jgi:hypothetical protein